MQEPKIYSVKEITRLVKNVLEANSELQDFWVRGEISNFNHHARGHMYFTVKDEESRLRTVMFAGYNRYLKFIPKNGMKVLIRGSIGVYERDGQYQFYAKEMQPDGLGNLHLAFEQLKKKLEQEGLFSPDRKRPLPVYPKVIGVITSPTGAAVRDIVTTIRRRYPAAEVLLYPVLVQGEQAPRSISRAIAYMSQRTEVDVLIVGRGGGSLEELWAFNEEIVARSIHACSIPVISAVGHETDFTIADFVADVRAATPTAAAELAVPHLKEIHQKLDMLRMQLVNNLQQKLKEKRNRLESLQKSYAFRHPKNLVLQYEQRLDRAQERLLHRGSKMVDYKREYLKYQIQRLLVANPRKKLQNIQKERLRLNKELARNMHNRIREVRQHRAHLIGQLDALSPLKVMQRGYSLVYNEDNQLIKSVRKINPGDAVRVKMTDGQLDCQVWGIEEGGNNESGSE
ncbi:MAG: exodeoxyribonuclease VII large subunit [Bacillaceae bacterium]|nr:exodeoxyribonuclease VII large subunit [Bacillaceae bacterium]